MPATQRKRYIRKDPKQLDAYWIRSQSSDREYYSLHYVNGLITCTCPAYTYRATCKHIAHLDRRLMRDGVIKRQRVS